MNQKIYLVKKDPNTTGKDVQWEQLSREQFYQFIKSPEGKGRRFIRLTDDIDFECPEIYIEATYEEYCKWKSGYNRHQYLMEQAEDYEVVSADVPVADNSSLMDILADTTESVEEAFVRHDEKARLKIVVKQLSAKEQRLIELLYFQEKMELREITAELGITHQALYKQKKKVLEKIRTLLVADLEKSQQ